jgi:hypothetical protein
MLRHYQISPTHLTTSPSHPQPSGPIHHSQGHSCSRGHTSTQESPCSCLPCPASLARPRHPFSPCRAALPLHYCTARATCSNSSLSHRLPCDSTGLCHPWSLRPHMLWPRGGSTMETRKRRSQEPQRLRATLLNANRTYVVPPLCPPPPRTSPSPLDRTTMRWPHHTSLACAALAPYDNTSIARIVAPLLGTCRSVVGA